ncbi:RNA-binding protein [Cupriavidus sp. H39]|uniref:RNA-binding protein n=1 Tax=Cupriavidus sp. H39 TaxID=3401635 RepID=UPI003D06CDFC
MSRLLLSNIDPGTSDEEIQAFLEKYGFPPFDNLEHEDGDGSHPAVLLTYGNLDPAVLGKLQQRIDHMYWKKRQLSASILHDRFA